MIGMYVHKWTKTKGKEGYKTKKTDGKETG